MYWRTSKEAHFLVEMFRCKNIIPKSEVFCKMKRTKRVDKPIYKKWWFWVIIVLVIGVFGNMGNSKKDKELKTNTSISTPLSSTSKESASEDSTKESFSKEITSSEVSLSKKKKLKKIDLKAIGEFQFSGHANIKPTKAKIKGNKLTFYFDWRNDDGSVPERSFNGSSVTVIAYQDGKELEQLTDTYSGNDQYIEKNTTLEINFDYSLINHSPVTIKLLPLEGESQDFSFEILE